MKSKSQTFLKRAWVLLFCTIFYQQLVAQVSTVTGIVTDLNGEPVIGANIVIKENNTGTITDINGQFSLDKVAGNATLVFSYIGYKTQEVKVDGRKTINIRMEDDVQAKSILLSGWKTTHRHWKKS